MSFSVITEAAIPNLYSCVGLIQTRRHFRGNFSVAFILKVAQEDDVPILRPYYNAIFFWLGRETSVNEHNTRPIWITEMWAATGRSGRSPLHPTDVV